MTFHSDFQSTSLLTILKQPCADSNDLDKSQTEQLLRGVKERKLNLGVKIPSSPCLALSLVGALRQAT